MDLLKMPNVVYREFEKGDYIIQQGEKIDFLYYLEEGSCYRTTTTEKGNEIIYGIKESLDSFVHSLLGVLILYGDGVSPYHFIAKTKCSCYKIPKETFFEYVKDRPDILTQLIHMAIWEIMQVTDFFQTRQEGKTANRLCKLLLENAQNKNGMLIVKKDYNNIKISQYLGVHEVTVSRILRALKNEGIIDKNKDGIQILDEEKLAAYADSEEDIKYG